MIESIPTPSPYNEKHAEMRDSINELDDVVNAASCLLDRINNTVEKTSSEPKAVQNLSSLHFVLSNGPSEIRDKSQELNEILNRIQEALF